MTINPPPLEFEMKKALSLLAGGCRLTRIAGKYQLVELDGCRVQRTLSHRTATRLSKYGWVDGILLPMFPDGGGSITPGGLHALNIDEKGYAND
jgi:hypothetical protein